MVKLIEAAARAGQGETVADAYGHLSEVAEASEIERLDTTKPIAEAARARLFFGDWNSGWGPSESKAQADGTRVIGGSYGFSVFAFPAWIVGPDGQFALTTLEIGL